MFLNFILYGLLNFSVVLAVTLPNILWDPRNHLFSCPNLKINVRPLEDELYFVCPITGLNTKELTIAERENKIYESLKVLLPNKTSQYNSCNSTGGTELLRCDNFDNYNTRHETFPRKKQFETTYPMEPGNTYYLLSTSSRTKESLDNDIGGSCLPSDDGRYFPLKMAIYLCSDDEVAAGKCPVCTTFECYLKGCGVWSDWKSTGQYFWNGTECLEKMTRTCTSTYGTCEGENEKFSIADNKNKCPLYIQKCTPSAVFIQTSTSCAKEYVATTVYKTSTQTPVILTTEVVKTITITPSGISPSLCSPIIQTEVTTVTKYNVSVVTSIRNVTKTVVAEKFVDIKYDKKFYITVAAAIIGSILAGIFILHAIFSYCEGNRLNRKVVTYSVVENQGDSSKTKVEYVKET